MSHSYDTSTYSADRGEVPARLDSPDQLRPLATAAFLEQEKSPGRLIYVRGSTRSGWGIYVLKALLEAVDLPSLGFLSEQGQHKFETEHGFTMVTVLDPSSLPGVAADLARLLERVKADPMLAMNADSDGSMFGIDEAVEALSRDYVSSNPAYDYGHVAGDDGQHPDYLFTWLRSVLRVVEVALSEDRAVIHVLKV
jgi:hypothetical protein